MNLKRKSKRRGWMLGAVYVICLCVCLLLNPIATSNTTTIAVNGAMFFVVGVIFLYAIRKFHRTENIANDFYLVAYNIEKVHEANQSTYLWNFYRNRKDLFHEHMLADRYNEFLEEMDRLDKSADSDFKCNIRDYVNQGIIDSAINRDLMNLVPGTMTGLGILGTFIGLAVGLQQFNTESPDAISNSIAPLIGGIKIAFHTSIFGMIFSLIFNFLYKQEIETANDAMEKFLNNFETYVIPDSRNSSLNLIMSYQKQQADSLSDMAIVVGKQVAVQIGEMIDPQLTHMNDTFDKFTAAAGTVQVDAVRSIVEKFVEEMDKLLGGSFSQLQGVIQNICSAEEENNSRISQSLSQIINMTDQITQINNLSSHTIHVLSGYIAKIDEFQKLINNNMQSVNHQMDVNNQVVEKQQGYVEQLIIYEKQISDAIKTFSDDMSQQTEQIQRMLDDISSSAEKNVESVVALTEKCSSNLTETTNRQVQSVTDHVTELFAEFNKKQTETIQQMEQELSDDTKKNAEALTQISEECSKHLTEVTESHIKSVIDYSRTTAGDLTKAAAELNQAAQQFNDNIQKNIRSTFDSFDENLSEIAAHLSGTIHQVDETTGRVPKVVAAAYEGMEKSFEQITKILDGFIHSIEAYISYTEKADKGFEDKDEG